MKVIAHRGASGYAPENTMSAFNRAAEMNVHGIELDVQMSRDNEIVVIHDYKVDRTTNGVGKVRQHTLEELQGLDAGTWFNVEFKDERIVTLEEVFEKMPKDMLINVEIKNQAKVKDDIAVKLVELIEKHDRQEKVIISSFDHTVLKEVSDLNDSIRLGVLLYASLVEPWRYIKRMEMNIHSIHSALEYTDKTFIEESQKRGYKVYVYTVNDRVDAQYLMDSGVDGIITNYPDII